MKKFYVKNVANYNEIDIDKLTQWMHDWWAQRRGWTVEKTKYYMEHCFHKDRLPMTLVAFNEQNEEVGMCQLNYQDLDVRPDIYPYVAKVFVEPNSRGNNITKLLLAEAIKEAKRLGFKTIYLYTKHQNLYDKYGWEIIEYTQTFKSESPLEPVYKFDIE